jgi:hypothetical protein
MTKWTGGSDAARWPTKAVCIAQNGCHNFRASLNRENNGLPINV